MTKTGVLKAEVVYEDRRPDGCECHPLEVAIDCPCGRCATLFVHFGGCPLGHS